VVYSFLKNPKMIIIIRRIADDDDDLIIISDRPTDRW